jgi:hypothetical protein
MKDKYFHNALPVGHRLNSYEIQMVLGQSELSIAYLALNRFQKLLAVEEFFPSQLATRSGDGSVHPTSNNVAAAYNEGLKSFIAETCTLTLLRQASIPRVYPVLEFNNTAYRVMDYERGESLQSVLNEAGIIGEKNILDVLMPLLDGVEYIHLAGFVHGGIRPDNIVLSKKGPPLLLGFGSDQRAIAKDNKQGPWADIYALAACFYPAIYPGGAGQVTPDARSRIRALAAGNPDPLIPAIELGGDRYSRPFLAAIDRALNILPEERVQSIAEWRVLLNSDEEIVVNQSPSPREEAGIAAKRALDKARAAAEEAAIERARIDAESAAFRRSSRRWLAAAALIIVVVAGSISMLYRPTEPISDGPANDGPQSAATVSSDKKEASEIDIAQLLPLLNNASCVSAAAAIDNGVIHLTGYSALASATSNLITALKQKTGGDSVQNGIADVSAEKCALLEAYRSAWRSNQGSKPGATLSTRNPGNVFRTAERLKIDLTTSDYPSYLYIDFFLLDGTVLHMVPSSLNRGNQAPARYEATIGDMGDWVAAPPFGEEIVVMLSSSAPLFKDERPEHESAANYLAALAGELERASKNQETRITASFLLITTKPAD